MRQRLIKKEQRKIEKDLKTLGYSVYSQLELIKEIEDIDKIGREWVQLRRLHNFWLDKDV